MTFGCLMISIRTHLGWVMLAKGKRAVTKGCPWSARSICLHFHFFFDISSFTFYIYKGNKTLFLILHEASSKARIQGEFPDAHVNIICTAES